MAFAEPEFDYATEAFTAVDELERLSDPATVAERLAAAFAMFGFQAFLVTRMPMQAERLEPYVLLNGWPREWYERYMRVNHYRHDPVARNCFATTQAFLWSEVPYDPSREPRAEQVMREAADLGLKEGFCVPMHDAWGFQAAVTMAGDRVELPPKARRAAHFIALFAYGASSRMKQASASGASQALLTDREREVLRWTAIGKSAWEVGRILGISERTVVMHLQNARRKLGTNNRLSTVVEALRRREIRV